MGDGTGLSEPKFDRLGRYLIVPPEGGEPVAYTRATTLAASLDDRYSLEHWSRRMVAMGLARRADLLANVAASKQDETERLDELCSAALEAGGSSKSANLGQALHKFSQRIDRGEDLVVPEPWAADIDAYREAMKEAGLEVHLVETTVVVPELGVAGTADRIVKRRGHFYVVDLKTGQKLDYSWPSIAVQLAVYAHAETRYDWALDEHYKMPAVSRTTGIVAHLPAGQGRCELIGVDLEAGWRGALLAARVREFRKEAFRTPWRMAENAERREWLVHRVQRLVRQYPAAAKLLAARWPKGLPTLKEPGHNDRELQEILRVVESVEVEHEVPAFPEPDPAFEASGASQWK